MKIGEMDPKLWEEWVASRPPMIQEMCRKYPPDRLYRMKSTGRLVTMYSYSEDGTVTVNVSSNHNEGLFFDRSVFGVDPADLEETP